MSIKLSIKDAFLKYAPEFIVQSLKGYRRKLNYKRKTKIRSEVQLSDRFEGLLRTSQVLENLGVDWHLSGGTALGVARDGDFIPWDWDVGFGLKSEQVLLDKSRIIQNMREAGLDFVKEVDRPLNETLVFAWKKQEMELLLWTLDGENRVRSQQTRPARFFDNIEYRKLRGKEFPFPSPLEEYLAFLYGDWHIPKRTADKNVYRSPESWK